MKRPPAASEGDRGQGIGELERKEPTPGNRVAKNACFYPKVSGFICGCALPRCNAKESGAGSRSSAQSGRENACVCLLKWVAIIKGVAMSPATPIKGASERLRLPAAQGSTPKRKAPPRPSMSRRRVNQYQPFHCFFSTPFPPRAIGLFKAEAGFSVEMLTDILGCETVFTGVAVHMVYLGMANTRSVHLSSACFHWNPSCPSR